jgi:hypothetical protein
MKKLINISILITLILPIFLAYGQERGIIPVPIKDHLGKEVGLYTGSYALLIGINNYKAGWPDLPGVISDLDAVGKTLDRLGFSIYRVVNPTREQLQKAIDGFISKYGYKKDNRLLIYFAGHGYTITPKYGGSEMGYIVPSDAKNPNLDEQAFLKTAMSMQSIEVFSRNIQSKHALLTI